MNVQLRDITVTARDGRVSHLDQVYIRGSHVRFFIVPDMLRNAPMFKSRTSKALVPPPPSSGSSAQKLESVQPFHHIETPYYSAKVPIWTDNIDDPGAWSQEWRSQDGASEVVKAVGAWIVAFAKPATKHDLFSIKTLLSSISSVLAYHTSDSYDLPSSDTIQLAIGLPQPISPALELPDAEWDDICRENGNWEFIDSSASGTPNEYGEKTGLPRLLEALQSGEWEASVDTFLESDFDDILDDADEDLEEGFDPADAAADTQVKDPILGSLKTGEGAGEGKGDDDVEGLQKMLVRMQAARDLGEDLPSTERKRMAREAVKDVMRDF
ncbi:MAG: hypothetical protein MMC23_006853 [Stictis urceolatum]|nr:hypothetical protein [Stictis urceolata]